MGCADPSLHMSQEATKVRPPPLKLCMRPSQRANQHSDLLPLGLAPRTAHCTAENAGTEDIDLLRHVTYLTNPAYQTLGGEGRARKPGTRQHSLLPLLQAAPGTPQKCASPIHPIPSPTLTPRPHSCPQSWPSSLEAAWPSPHCRTSGIAVARSLSFETSRLHPYEGQGQPLPPTCTAMRLHGQP